jgi:hypothetical protein
MSRISWYSSFRNCTYFANVILIVLIFIGPISSYQQVQNNTNLSEEDFRQVPDGVSNSVLDVENMNRTSEDFFQNPRLVPPGGISEAQAINDSSSSSPS